MKRLKSIRYITVRWKTEGWHISRPLNLPWKKLLSLTWDPIWHSFIVVISYASIFIHLLHSMNGKCEDLLIWRITEILYALDILYLIDVILTIGSKIIPNVDLPEINPSMRPLVVLMLDIISVIPFEIVVLQVTQIHMKIFCLFRLNRCLKMVRVLHIFHVKRSMLNSNIGMWMVELYTLVTFFVMATNSLFCNIQCFNESCAEGHICVNYRSIAMIIAKISRAGLAHFPIYLFTWDIVSSITALAVVLLVYNVILAYFTLGLFNTYHHQIEYVSSFNTVLKKLKLHVPGYPVDKIVQLYDIFWQECHGYRSGKRKLYTVTPALRSSVMIDISWTAFQHSQLMRAMDLPFLRHISMQITKKFLLPGDYIFRKNEWKEKMVYVVSGSVQLLSEIDGESPILTLCSGTILGESSILVSYKSTNSVCCKTFCELHILRKRDFLQGTIDYPEQYKALRTVIAQRYDEARKTRGVAKAARRYAYGLTTETDTWTMFWIKNTLHRLMSKDPETAYRHENPNIYLQYETNHSEFDKMAFWADYLDLLVIEELVIADRDSVFVKSTFPCILQSNSFLVYVWEAFVITLALLLCCIIPIVCFIDDDMPNWYVPTVGIITLTFWFDIYVQLSTSVQKRLGSESKFSDIVTSKLEDPVFWADLLTCLPCEILSPIVLTNLSQQKMARMHLNRLLKLLRVEKLFRMWEGKFNANIILIRFVKFFLIYLYTAFLFYCIQRAQNLPPHVREWFYSVQMVTGIGIIDANFDPNDPVFAIGGIVFPAINLLLYANIASAFLLKKVVRLEVRFLAIEILSKPTKWEKRIRTFIDTQWLFSNCWDIRSTEPHLRTVSKTTYEETQYQFGGELMRSATFFEGCFDEVINYTCTNIHCKLYPPGEVIIYVGDISKDIFYVYGGVCVAVDEDDELLDVVLPRSTAINLMEACYDIPTYRTCKTVTHCWIVTLNRDALFRTLTRYPSEWYPFFTTISVSADIKDRLVRNRKAEAPNLFVSNKSEQSFYHFGFNLKVDSYEEYDYYVPYDWLYPFSFVRYFFWRSTILPHGKFLLVWEALRATFAALTAILYFVPPVMLQHRRFVYFLDFTALLDIYVRFHVCYYDERQVLIKHPLRTAMHYLRNGILIDVLAILPFDVFVENVSDYMKLWLVYLNRLLQLHRYVQFFWLRSDVSTTPVNKYWQLAYVPLMVILCNFFGTVLINSECKFEVFAETPNNINFTCAKNSILSVSPFKKPIYAVRGYLYGGYIATSALTTVGFQGYETESDITKIIITALGIIGVSVTVIFCGRMLALHSFRNDSFFDYQEGMHTIKRYMRDVGVSEVLSATMKDTLELNWRHKKGKDICELTHIFNLALRIDILYDLYGEELHQNSIFIHRTKTFYRNLLPYMKHYGIVRGGYLETINDVSQNMYVLHKGEADVLGADGTKLDTLYPGSLFGNLENQPRARLQVSIVAACNTDVIQIESIHFHKVLTYHPKVKREFHLLKARYLSYIPVPFHHDYFKVTVSEKPPFFSINPHSRLLRYWKIFVLIVPVYLGTQIELYQLGVKEFSVYLLVFLYACDVLYMAQYAVQFLTAYEDEKGDIITNHKLIKRRILSGSLAHSFQVVSLVPMDTVIFIWPMTAETRHFVFGFLRLNRYFRLQYVFEYFRDSTQSLNCNIHLMRFVFIIVWTTILINALAASLGSFSCYAPDNMQPQVPSCKELSAISSYDKFRLYGRLLYLAVAGMTCTSQHVYYPQGAIFIVMFTVVMLVSHYFHVVCVCQTFVALMDWNRAMLTFSGLFDRIRYFIEFESLSPTYVKKVLRYVNYMWVQQKSIGPPQLLKEVPVYLQDAVFLDAFSHLVGNHVVFLQCHVDCLRQIIQKIEPKTYFADYYVVFSGAVDRSMYFVLKGEVAVLKEEQMHKDNVVSILHPGDSFGILQGLQNKTPHLFTYRCTKRSIILRLNLDNWEYLLNFFPASRERIREAALEYVGL